MVEWATETERESSLRIARRFASAIHILQWEAIGVSFHPVNTEKRSEMWARLERAVAASRVNSIGLDLSDSIPTAASHLGITVSARCKKIPLARHSMSAA